MISYLKGHNIIMSVETLFPNNVTFTNSRDLLEGPYLSQISLPLRAQLCIYKDACVFPNVGWHFFPHILPHSQEEKYTKESQGWSEKCATHMVGCSSEGQSLKM